MNADQALQLLVMASIDLGEELVNLSSSFPLWRIKRQDLDQQVTMSLVQLIKDQDYVLLEAAGDALQRVSFGVCVWGGSHI